MPFLFWKYLTPAWVCQTKLLWATVTPISIKTLYIQLQSKRLYILLFEPLSLFMKSLASSGYLSELKPFDAWCADGNKKSHLTYLNKPATFSCMFVYVCVTSLLPPGIKGLGSQLTLTLLYPWKFQTKQSSTPGYFTKLCQLDPLELPRPKTKTPGNSTLFFLVEIPLHF